MLNFLEPSNAFLMAAFVFSMAKAEISTDYSFLLKETQSSTKITNEEFQKAFKLYTGSMSKTFTAPRESVVGLEQAIQRLNLSNEDFNEKLEKTVREKALEDIEVKNKINKA